MGEMIAGAMEIWEMYLAIFDLDWNLLKEYPITNYGALKLCGRGCLDLRGSGSCL